MYAVREGQQVIPTCPKCGCRLQELGPRQEDGHCFLWTHYHVWDESTNKWSIKDARGCLCEYTYMGLWLRRVGDRPFSTGEFFQQNPIPMFTGPFIGSKNLTS